MGSLFEASSRGDRAGQEEIARLMRHFARVLCRGGGPPGAPDLDWEDVAQEALRKLFHVGLGQYRGQGSEKSYLFSIVKCTMIQMARTAHRRRRREANAVAEDLVPPHNPGPRMLVTRILNLVSAECRELLERVFLYGEPYAELAHALAMEESSVRAKVSRCIRKARTAMTDAGTE